MGEKEALKLLLILTAVVGIAQAYCRQGSEWIEFNGSCYHWTRAGTNWFRAELNCKRVGGHLVSIGSFADRDFVLRLTQCSSDFWVGMVNTGPKNVISGYEWWDGTPHNYTALSPQNSAYLDCVVSNKAGSWHNTYCQNNIGYVCKTRAAQGSIDDSDNESEFFTGNFTTAATRRPISPTSVVPVTCPSGWEKLDSNCYFVSSNRTNYFNAQMSCQSMGSSVTSVLTAREHTLLTVHMGCNSAAWIGFEKARPCFRQPSQSYCWVWMDRSPVNYLEWAPNQNLDTREAECVILNGQWFVANCYSEFRYICKKPAYSLNANDIK